MGILDAVEQPTGQTQPMQPQRPPQGMPMKGEEKPFNAQDAFDKFVIEAMKLLHTPKITESLIKQMKSSDDTVEAIGQAALNIVMRLESSASESGFPLRANTIINGLNVIVGELINIAVAAGAKPFSDEQKYQAFSWALSKYLEEAVQSGKITQEQLQQVVEGFKAQGGETGKPQEMQGPQGQQPKPEMPQGGM